MSDSDTTGTATATTAQDRPSATATLTRPVRAMASTVSHVPGATSVTSALGGVLDKVSAVSPRTRRIAAYAGAGVLGAVGVVEWPVAAAGAAVVWLTQPRARQTTPAGDVAETVAQARETVQPHPEDETAHPDEAPRPARTVKPSAKTARSSKPRAKHHG